MTRARWVALACAVAVVTGGAATGATYYGDHDDTAQETRGASAHAVTNAAVTTAVAKPVGFVGTAPGKPIPLAGGGGEPVKAARAHLRRYGARFGIRDPQRQLRTTAALRGTGGQSIVRFQQVRDGVPVLGGELAVAVDSHGGLLSMNGETSRTATGPAGTAATATARVSAAKAASVALDDTAGRQRRDHSALRAAAPQTWLYDPSLVGAPGLPVARRVWRVDVTARSGQPLSQLVLVDARTGRVALSVDRLAEADDQAVCNAANQVAMPLAKLCDGVALAPVRVSDATPSNDAEVDKAWDNARRTIAFYQNTLGLDLKTMLGSAVTGVEGPRVRSTVRFCPEGNCATTPYQNAFWYSEPGVPGQMFYGQGFASADDVVGHELTHGVTEHISHLFYYAQSGAINESMSDVFGELIDLSTNDADDRGTKRWLLGEDLPASVGAIRSMKNPPQFAQPDKMSSSYWKSDWYDNGGVHRNDGVGNKAAYLITDGGTFNGQTVTGLGIAKTAKIYFRTQQLLTSGADYADLYVVLPQACNELVGAETGITAADCTQVQKAVTATEMNRKPATEPTPAPAPYCPANTVKAPNIALDTFEPDSEPSGFTWAPATPEWEETNLYTTRARGEQSGYQLHGEDPPTTSNLSKAMATGVAIPAGTKTFARFNHAYGFDWNDAVETTPRTFWDGGFVEVSSDDGAHWTPATFTNNGPTRQIKAANNSVGFGGDSLGWISSRIDLSAFAGKTVRLRFRIAADESPAVSAGVGWFIDNLRIYSCTALPSAPTSVSALGGIDTATVSWQPPAQPGASPVSSYEVTAYPGGTPVTLPATARSYVVRGLQPHTTYTFGVRAVSAVGKGPEAKATLTGTVLSFYAPPAFVIYGGKVTFSGKLTRVGSGSAVSGAVVQLQGKRPGQTEWTALANAHTTATGAWSVVLAPPRNSAYRAVYGSHSTSLLGSISTTRNLPVRFAVTAVPSTTTPRAGTQVRITGTERPARTGATVQLQRYVNSQWVVLATTTASSTGTYSFTRSFTRGTWTLRTVVPGDVNNATGGSKPFALTVS